MREVSYAEKKLVFYNTRFFRDDRLFIITNHQHFLFETFSISYIE